MTRCPNPILQTGSREVVPAAVRTWRGSPGRRAVARPGQHPPEHPTWAPGLHSPWSNSGAMGLPADSAALFQPWSGLRVAEDRGSFSAEKPQITPATEPDKASVRGSLPDRPCCSCQPQGPLQPKPVSRGPPLPGISAFLFQRLKNRLADLSPPISSVWLSEVPEASGPKSRINQSSDLLSRRECQGMCLSVEFQTVTPRELGGWWSGRPGISS